MKHKWPTPCVVPEHLAAHTTPPLLYKPERWVCSQIDLLEWVLSFTFMFLHWPCLDPTERGINKVTPPCIFFALRGIVGFEVIWGRPTERLKSILCKCVLPKRQCYQLWIHVCGGFYLLCKNRTKVLLCTMSGYVQYFVVSAFLYLIWCFILVCALKVFSLLCFFVSIPVVQST